MVKHLCEICQVRYDTVPEAERCEAQGILGPRYRPGLILIRTDTKSSDWLKNTFIILKVEKPKGHDRIYRVGSTTFAPDDDPSNFLDRWEWGLYTGRDIKQGLKEGKLTFSNPEQRSGIERVLSVCQMEIERAKAHPEAYSRPGGITEDMVQCFERYPVRLHSGLKERF
jgi:hypothetical protein